MRPTDQTVVRSCLIQSEKVDFRLINPEQVSQAKKRLPRPMEKQTWTLEMSSFVLVVAKICKLFRPTESSRLQKNKDRKTLPTESRKTHPFDETKTPHYDECALS